MFFKVGSVLSVKRTPRSETALCFVENVTVEISEKDVLAVGVMVVLNGERIDVPVFMLKMWVGWAQQEQANG